MGASPHPIHLLHVDDELDQAEVTAEFLTRIDNKLSIDTVTNPSEALNLLGENGYDCVVSDYDMPEQTGIGFLKAVRETHADLPFILYTGKGSEEVASEAIRAGVTDYLQKGTGRSHYEVLANRIANSVSAARDESQLEETLTRVTDAIYTLDSAWQFTYVNEHAEQILEMREGELLGSSIWEEFPELTDGIVEEHYRTAMETQNPVSFEYYFPPLDIWVAINVYPSETGLSVYFVDISEQKTREEKLRETSRRLDLALNATDTGVWSWDMETDEVVWSETLERLLGIEAGTFRGTYEAHAEYVHPDDIPVVEQAIEEAPDGDGNFQAEFRMNREDGEQIWVEGRGKTLTDNGDRRMLGTTTDITNRKESEQALARREVLDPTIELEFHADQIADLVQAESEDSIELSIDGVVAKSDGTQLLFGSLQGRSPKEFMDILGGIPTVVETSLLSTVGDSSRLEVTVDPDSVFSLFAAFDGELQSLKFENHTCKLVGEFPETVDPVAVIQAAKERYSDIELASQRRVLKPRYLRGIIKENLTERQRTVLGMAYFAGYFDQPRQNTGEELGDRLDITRQTFNSHLRKALATLVDDLFDERIELPS